MRNRSINTINFALRFVGIVFAITFFTGIIGFSLAMLFFHVGIFNFETMNPFYLILLYFLANLILGTIIAAIVSRRSIRQVGNLLGAVEQIGKGNFDVEINTEGKRGDIVTISENINKMAKDLKGVEIMRSDFISNFSHEFKTPIVSIQGFAKRLMTKDLPADKQREYLGIIYEESTRLAELSANTLYMSKLDSMNATPPLAPFPLDEQLRQCIVLLEKQLTQKEIELTVDLHEIEYTGNEETLCQVWINLLTNAIKFTPEKGSILISATPSDGGVIVSVSDNGIGMDKETVSRIFDKFYQRDTSRATQGNGLGLSIAKKIIQMHNGTISVQSTPSTGTTFTVSLPQ